MAFAIQTADLLPHLKVMGKFISPAQVYAITHGIRGEEGDYFREQIVKIGNKLADMPKTYDQDGLGDEAVAHLHYFVGGFDAWITEKDVEDDQLQAFGLVHMHGGDPELGYINIQEITEAGAELDMHFTPKTISEIKSELFENERSSIAPG